jgi:hypothetical protein
VTTNMVTAATIQSAAEALALMQAFGLPLEKFVKAMEGNASNSKTLGLKLPKILQRNFEPHFSVKHMLKDMQIASRMGLTSHLELGVTSAARDRLLEQMQRGFGDEDYSAVARKYFAETPPPERAEAELELFTPPAPMAEPQWVDLAPAPPAKMVAPAPEAMPEVDFIQPPVEASAPSISYPEETPAEPAVEEELPQELVQPEAEERRGFFDRLLRR